MLSSVITIESVSLTASALFSKFRHRSAFSILVYIYCLAIITNREEKRLPSRVEGPVWYSVCYWRRWPLRTHAAGFVRGGSLLHTSPSTRNLTGSVLPTVVLNVRGRPIQCNTIIKVIPRTLSTCHSRIWSAVLFRTQRLPFRQKILTTMSRWWQISNRSREWLFSRPY